MVDNILRENIIRIQSLLTEGKDSLVTRTVYDQDYEEQYPKWGKLMVKCLGSEINAYGEDDNTIVLYNENDNTKYLMRYDKNNEQIWWDYTLQNNLMKLIPYRQLSRHFKYVIQDFFKHHFPQYGVREITGAYITNY